MSDDTLLVLGAGLIGSSIARAARRGGLAKTILIADPDSRTAKRADEIGLGDEVGDDAKAFASRADIVAVCAPPAAIADAARAVASKLKPSAVMFDTGSIKGAVIAATRDLPNGAAKRFVPAHPIAGTERSGPEAGFAELFDGRWCVLTPDKDTDADAAAKVTAFWRGCGARVAVMSAAEHDSILAATSHVPHLVAYALTATARDADGAARDAMVRFSAGGFRDFTRIAASNPVMWRDVFVANKDAVLAALDRFAGELDVLRAAVAAGDGAALEEFFSTTRSVREAIVAAGQETEAPDFGRGRT